MRVVAIALTMAAVDPAAALERLGNKPGMRVAEVQGIALRCYEPRFGRRPICDTIISHNTSSATYEGPGDPIGTVTVEVDCPKDEVDPTPVAKKQSKKKGCETCFQTYAVYDDGEGGTGTVKLPRDRGFSVVTHGNAPLSRGSARSSTGASSGGSRRR